MRPAIIAVFEPDPRRNMEQTVRVITPEERESEWDFYDRVQAEANSLARRTGAECVIYAPNSAVTIPVEVEEIA